MKKILMGAIISLLFIPAAVVFADIMGPIDFSDVPSGSWFKLDVDYLSQRGIIEGYEDGTFRPVNNINRAEASTMMARLHRSIVNSQETDKEDVLAAIESLNSKINALTEAPGECYYDGEWYDIDEDVSPSNPIGIPDYAETGGLCHCTEGGYISCSIDHLL
jgi:hypothetical protein